MDHRFFPGIKSLKNSRKRLTILGMSILIFIVVTWLPIRIAGLVLGDIEVSSVGWPTDTAAFLAMWPLATYYFLPVPCGIPVAISLGLSY